MEYGLIDEALALGVMSLYGGYGPGYRGARDRKPPVQEAHVRTYKRYHKNQVKMMQNFAKACEVAALLTDLDSGIAELPRPIRRRLMKMDEASRAKHYLSVWNKY